MRRQSAKDKELEDNARLLRKWHAKQLEEALAGLHADVLGRLMAQLKDLRSARELVASIEAVDWATVDADTRAVALFEKTAPSPSCASARAKSRLTTRYPASRCAHFR